MSNRRSFLKLSATAATSAMLLPKLGWSQADRLGGPVFSNASVGAYQQGLITLVGFQKLVGSEFKAFLDNNEAAWLRLRQAVAIDYSLTPEKKKARLAAQQVIAPTGADLTLARNPVQPDTFELRFDIRGPNFPQNSYLLDHGTLGRFVAYLQPSTPGRCYATFTSFPAAGQSNARHGAVVEAPPAGL